MNCAILHEQRDGGKCRLKLFALRFGITAFLICVAYFMQSLGVIDSAKRLVMLGQVLGEDTRGQTRTEGAERPNQTREGACSSARC